MSEEGVEFAWRVHSAIVDWTGKVDSKASFALTIESAVLGGVVALSTPDGVLGTLHGVGDLVPYRAGVVLLALAVLCAVLAVIPQVRARQTTQGWEDNVVYFGHLRHWDAAKLAATYAELVPLPVLARQNVAMSKIAWRKHRLVQLSLALAVIGSLAVTLAAV